MPIIVPLLAALGVALCNGIAAVLQKRGADSEKPAASLDPGLMLRLIQNLPYLMGTLLDGVAWLLTLVAVHSLPLFVAQPIIALSVVCTALIEWLFQRQPLTLQTVGAIGLTGLGLSLIASQAAAETARTLTATSLLLLTAVVPAALIIAGALTVRIRNQVATTLAAVLAGIAYGGTAITGRILVFSPPYWHVLFQPAFIALIIYGAIGIMLFTITLQRSRASTVSAALVTFETLFPTIVGLILLGDTPRSGQYGVIIAGSIIALAGTILIVMTQPGAKVQAPASS